MDELGPRSECAFSPGCPAAEADSAGRVCPSAQTGTTEGKYGQRWAAQPERELKRVNLESTEPQIGYSMKSC